MTTKKIPICDICGEQFYPYTNKRIKMKIRWEDYCNYDDFEWTKWKKFDICPCCADKVISLINGEGEDDTLEPMVERLEDDIR